MGPLKTKSLFEEYFYACLAALFLGISLLLVAGGMGAYESLVVAAWVAGAIWCGKQLKGYWGEKGKERDTKAAADAAAAEAAAKQLEGPNGKVKLPPGMKPIIGVQWPVKTGAFPTRPGLRSAPSVPPQSFKPPAESAPAAPANGAPAPAAPAPAAPENAGKPSFVYERPTLPDRKPKLPHNWPGREPKKPRR